MILICYIFSTNKVFEIRLVVIIPLTTIPKFNWQLCLKLTDPNFAWFNSQSTKKVPTLGLAFSYLRTSILSVFYAQFIIRRIGWLYFKTLATGFVNKAFHPIHNGLVELWLPYDRFRWIMVDFYIASSYLRTSILSVFYAVCPHNMIHLIYPTYDK